VTTQTANVTTEVDPPAAQKSALAKRLPLILVLTLGAAGYAGWRIWEGSRPYEWSGTVEARTISVGSRVGGRVKDVLAKEGDRVEQGKPLLELEPGDLPAQRLVAKGELDSALATLDKLKRGARPEEIEEAKARAQTASAALEETRVGARQEQIAAANARLVANSL
jgi:multidrug resistance efflux pump